MFVSFSALSEEPNYDRVRNIACLQMMYMGVAMYAPSVALEIGAYRQLAVILYTVYTGSFEDVK